MFIGNLGQDPEVRYTNDGTAIATISVAVSEKWKGKDGNQQEKTEWVRCVAFNRLAEVMGQYLRKGSKVYIEGKMQTRSWEDQSGATKYATEIVVKEMQMLSPKAEGQQARVAVTGSAAPHPQAPTQDQGFADLEDIPF